MLKLTQGCAAPQSATLSFSHDHDPGITRVRRGKGWSFHLPCGTRIADKAELARLAAIAMPPAYQRCWFCVDPQGHIQATGYDARGRKQYRYHPQFRAGQDATKYALCAAFGEALPTMRAQIEAVLTDHTPTNRAPTRERCLAAIVRLLDIGHFRIGNEQYARSNRSFGISTLRKRHVNLHGNSIELSYRGKSGKMQNRILHDRALLQIVKGLADLSGQRLFQYVDELGARHDIGSSDVNRYISEIMGAQFSAKHFRTWGGTLVAFEAWTDAGGAITLDAVMRQVADELGNTPTISRKSYVHPAVIAAIKSGKPPSTILQKAPRPTKWLQSGERALVAFLRAQDGVPDTRAAALA
ncbi:DNA topoisomerase IB [Novosphingobium sp.]|uniref:DNA topoisomerase IB n=1 Tax=Novosphingobium sp. TaxID=1874826 RepID=UPI003B51580F